MLQSALVEVRKTEGFERWFQGLKDKYARGRIAARLKRLAKGHAGDAKNVGLSVWELRVHAGPGYRVYFTRVGERIVLLLAGGDKSTQERDIAAAVAIARMVREGL